MEAEKIRHESFGQIRFSRNNSGPTRFYGSELDQDHYITMEVHNSEIERGLTQDRYYTRGAALVKVRMSSGRFSELITSLNINSGVPCTIEILGVNKVADLPTQESRKDFVHRKFEDRMKEFADTIKERQERAKELVKKKTLSKDDIHSLTHHIEWLTGEVERNIPFFAKCFQENMDEVVYEAKLEAENAIQHKLTTLGLKAMNEENAKIANG
jgi:hypothetical protein